MDDPKVSTRSMAIGLCLLGWLCFVWGFIIGYSLGVWA